MNPVVRAVLGLGLLAAIASFPSTAPAEQQQGGTPPSGSTTEPEPRPGESAEQLLTRLARTNARAAEMLTVLRRTREKYRNLAPEVESLIYQLAMAEFFPNTRRGMPVRPIWLIGPPSIGKSTMIREVIEALNLHRVFVPIRAREGDRYLPLQSVLTTPSLGNARGPQLILFVDEIQNIRRSPVETQAQTAAAQIIAMLKELRDNPQSTESQQRLLADLSNRIQGMVSYAVHGNDRDMALSDHLLWHLTGNGVLNLDPPGMDSNAIRGHQNNIADFVDAYTRTQEKVLRDRAALEAMPDGPEKDQARSSLRDLERGLASLELRSHGNGNRYIDFGATIKSFLVFKPHLFRPLLEGVTVGQSESIGEALFRVIAADPLRAGRILQEQVNRFGFNQDIDAGRVIIIFAGNDQPFLAEAIARARDARDPDSVHEAGMTLLRERGARFFASRMLAQVFGSVENAEAFLSRMGVFTPKTPLDAQGLRLMIGSMVSSFSDAVAHDLRDNGIPVTAVRIENSVSDRLYTLLRHHHLDPRLILSEISQSLAAIHHELMLTTVATGRAAEVTSMRLVYDAAQGKFVATALSGDTVIATHQATPSIGTAAAPPTAPGTGSEGANQRKLRATNRASLAVAGGLIFGSMPPGISIEEAHFLNTEVTDLWRRGTLDNLIYQRNLLLVRLAGLAGEAEFMEETPHSERAVRERELAERLLEQIRGEIARMRELRHADAAGTTPLSELLPNRFREIVFSDIGRGLSNQEVIANAIRHVRGLLRDHAPMVARLATDLQTSTSLTAEQLQDRAEIDFPPDIARQIAQASPGGVEDNPCRLSFRALGFWGRFREAAVLRWRRLFS